MKTEENRASRVDLADRPVGTSLPATSAAPESSCQVQNSTSLMRIPEAELTPKVRLAIITLMEEVARLRHELTGSRGRIEHLECLADQDSLVPVYNRRAFLRELTRAISMTERYSAPSTLLYFDVDNMKHINDTYGHPAGDAALRHVAKTLIEQVRDSDVVGRLGGDEFGVILYQTDGAVGQRKLGQLAHEIGKQLIQFNDHEVAVGVSYGEYTLCGTEDAGQALAEADKNMYEKKHGSGRKANVLQQ